MNRRAKFFLWMIALLVTWVVCVYHRAVFFVPATAIDETADASLGSWIPKSDAGVNQLILSGTPMQRGLNSGRLAGHLVDRQEVILMDMLKKMIPFSVARSAIFLFLMRWFWGIDRYIEPWMSAEMWGVAQGTSHEFDHLADRTTRQAAYHGLHEVGQMATDMGETMGCTVFAVPAGGSWIIGRNFDFEGGRIFDDEKIVKWVFPDQGFAYVSVIWAGMVGAVTGVNEHGVYLSLNAAGSTDFRRYGTPSTLVLTKALQFARTAEEARKIVETETMFITDIFVVADRTSLFRIEKSPRRVKTHAITKPLVVTNHLVDKEWEGDRINDFRRRDLTSLARLERGEALIAQLKQEDFQNVKRIEAKVLSFVRDKGSANGRPLYLGNRAAIDALIATHTAIYNAHDNILYVSQGPAISERFIGFDLTASFRDKTVRTTKGLPRDPDVSPEMFQNVIQSQKLTSQAEGRVKAKDPQGAKRLLDEAAAKFSEHSHYYTVLGNYHDSLKEPGPAKAAWTKALDLHPPYLSQQEGLKRKLAK